MKTIILGATGQLGNYIGQYIKKSILLSHKNFELSNKKNIENIFKKFEPKYIFNCTAYHNLFSCEKNIKKSFEINTYSLKYLIDYCNLYNCKIIHFSTDYVFDGQKKSKYSETDIPNPVNIYGISKLAGEYIVKNYAKSFLIIRLSSLYSEYKCRAKKRGNFIEQIINNSKKLDKLFVTNEKITPTYIKDLTIQIIKIYKKINNKIIHISPPDSTTWFDFALLIKKKLKLETQIIKLLKNKKNNNDIKRPLNSSLDSKYLKSRGLYRMPDWKKSFENYLKLNSLILRNH